MLHADLEPFDFILQRSQSATVVNQHGYSFYQGLISGAWTSQSHLTFSIVTVVINYMGIMESMNNLYSKLQLLCELICVNYHVVFDVMNLTGI